MAETWREWAALSQRNETRESAFVDSSSTDHVHRLLGWRQPQTIVLILSPINLGLAWLTTARTESISIEIRAAVTAVTDFGMQDSPLIDKEREINSQFGFGMRLEWIKENSFFSLFLSYRNRESMMNVHDYSKEVNHSLACNLAGQKRLLHCDL